MSAVQVALHGVLGEQGFIDASHVEWGIHSNLVSARRVVSLDVEGQLWKPEAGFAGWGKPHEVQGFPVNCPSTNAMIAVKNPLQTFNLFWNYKIYRWAEPHEFVWCQYDPPTECSLLKHNINISSLLFIDVSRTISENDFHEFVWVLLSV